MHVTCVPLNQKAFLLFRSTNSLSWRVCPCAPTERRERYTAWWDHAPKDGVDQGGIERTQLDHVLLSRGLVEAVNAVEVRMHHEHSAPAVSDHWPMVVTISFPPGAFTNEEETWAEYWTRGRVGGVCLELVFCVVFYAGIFTLAWGKKRAPTFVDQFFGFGMGYGAPVKKTE